MKGAPKKGKVDIRNMSLNEFVRRYTSEDNASFQEIHDRDRNRFLEKIGWMFSESERFNQLNAMAIKNEPR